MGMNFQQLVTDLLLAGITVKFYPFNDVVGDKPFYEIVLTAHAKDGNAFTASKFANNPSEFDEALSQLRVEILEKRKS